MYDHPRLQRTAEAVQTLSLAFCLTGAPAYARHALTLLRTWFIEPATRMNPHMRFAQFIPGTHGVSGPPSYPPRWVEGTGGQGVYVSYGGAIEGSTFPPMVESIRRLHRAGAISAQEIQALRHWFDTYLDWLLTDPLGLDEKRARNNHSTWYCVQVVSYALFAGRDELARQYLDQHVPERIYQQIEPDGRQPEELVRADPVRYTCFNLAALMNLAVMGDCCGVDLWSLDAGQGRGLAAALRWLAARVDDAAPPIARELLRTAAHRFNEPSIWAAAAAPGAGPSPPCQGEVSQRIPRPDPAELLYPAPQSLRCWLT